MRKKATYKVLKRRQKYNSTKVSKDGMVFDSKLEFRMYNVLKRWQEEGKISDLQCQVRYELQPRFELVKKGLKRVNRPIAYLADFVFYDNSEKRIRVLDSKGAKTDVYLLKKKLFEYKFKDQGLFIENTL